MRIAVDMMGGDFAPANNLAGLALAVKTLATDIQLLAVGNREVLGPELARLNLLPHPRVELVHASQVIEMADKSVAALRAKKDSSVSVCADLLKAGRADAMVSPGHTGAAVAAAVVRNGMMKGVDRPGIATTFPGVHGPWVMVDCGANVDCKPLHLAQYAICGEVFSQCVLHVANPRVGLLNVGGEEGKGNELTRQSMPLLKQLPINFVGSIEGSGLFENEADVVICDGFVGNVVLKVSEGLARAMSGMLRERLLKTTVRKAGAFLSKNAFREVRQVTDSEEYGGAPLLGINGNCIIGHGASSPKAVCNAIRVAATMVGSQLNARTMERIAQVQWSALLAAAGTA